MQVRQCRVAFLCVTDVRHRTTGKYVPIFRSHIVRPYIVYDVQLHILLLSANVIHIHIFP